MIKPLRTSTSTATEPSSPLTLALLLTPQTPQPHCDATVPSTRTCQICLDAYDPITTITNSNSHNTTEPHPSLCIRRDCPTQVCASCLEQHIRILLADTLPGILPRMRCPVCLVPLRKSAWRSRVPSELVSQYEALCAKACAYLPPCCHEANYTQLPKSYASPPPALEAIWPSILHDKLPALQQRVVQFESHSGLTARAFVRFLDELIHKETETTQQELVEDVMCRIDDDERRAALLLAYYATHKRVTTHCCLFDLCFNCKRHWDDNHIENPTAPCDRVELTQHDMLQCRSCRVMIVKVEGCSAVECACGFAMSWPSELAIRDEDARHLIPVDMLDIDLFRDWYAWRLTMKSMVVWEVDAVREAWRRRQLERDLVVYGPRVRRMVQSFIWRRRFALLVPEMAREISQWRRRFLLQKLQRSKWFRLAVRGRLVMLRWRVCLRWIVKLHPTYDEEMMDANDVALMGGLFDEY